MLVLAFKVNEKCFIGNSIVVHVLRSETGEVRLGFEAPSNIEIDREKVRQSKIAEGRRPLNLFQGFGSGQAGYADH
jgi:carbon storage regulator